jgi:hypothetical protein
MERDRTEFENQSTGIPPLSGSDDKVFRMRIEASFKSVRRRFSGFPRKSFK